WTSFEPLRATRRRRNHNVFTPATSGRFEAAHEELRTAFETSLPFAYSEPARPSASSVGAHAERPCGLVVELCGERGWSDDRLGFVRSNAEGLGQTQWR